VSVAIETARRSEAATRPGSSSLSQRWTVVGRAGVRTRISGPPRPSSSQPDRAASARVANSLAVLPSSIGACAIARSGVSGADRRARLIGSRVRRRDATTMSNATVAAPAAVPAAAPPKANPRKGGTMSPITISGSDQLGKWKSSTDR
jgi:hypothetical protein